jgi:restriction endonuclease
MAACDDPRAENACVDVSDEYRALNDLAPNERGRRLPMLVARLLERDGYQALRAGNAASPRDADLFASSIDEDYLLEVKSGGKPAGLDAIDSLFVRLERMPSHVIGLVISRSGFTRGAMTQVTARRTRLILLFDGDELADLFEGRLTVRTLARAKRLALVRDAEMRFFGGRSVLELPGAADWARLPVPNVAFSDSAGDRAEPWIVSTGRNGDLVFAASIPDVDWTIAMGNGAGVDVDVQIRSLDDLAGMFESLRRSAWLTPAGRFAIHQTRASWHGAGARNFIDALRRQSERYASINVLLHNEEHAVYFDEYSAGLYTVALRVVVGADPWILGAQLSLQLPGVPLDPSALRLTMRALGLEEQAVFRSLTAAHHVTSAHFKATDVPLEVRGELIAVDALTAAYGETWISGLVASNPFQGARAPTLPDALRTALARTDTIICSLGSWYSANRRPSSFHLKRLDAVWTASALVVVAAADW